MAEFNAEIETTPIFQVFAATEKMRGLWMPVAAFRADNVAKSVVDASLQEGFAANMFKGVYKAQVWIESSRMMMTHHMMTCANTYCACLYLYSCIHSSITG